MTLDGIRAIDREFLTPAEVAAVLGCNPQGIRCWARQCPEALGFPVIIVGHRTKVPKRAFIAFMEGERREAVGSDRM